MWRIKRIARSLLFLGLLVGFVLLLIYAFSVKGYLCMCALMTICIWYSISNAEPVPTDDENF